MKAFFLSLIFACGVITANAQQVNSIDRVTAHYLSLKEALVNSNSELAKSKSGELLEVLNILPVKTLNTKQQKLWATYATKLKFDSRHISETTVLDHQREHFESLSKNMFALLSGLKMNNATLYQQYCPMKKASWLSDSEDIRNPYYGSDMMECGKVTATLKAGK